MKVYVAGSSAEMPRAEHWVKALREAGITVTSTWTDVITSVGSANPIGVSPEQRRSWSYTDLVVDLGPADWLWFLVPPPSVQTRGAWVELGVAFAARKSIICSGDTEQSIFCALGIERVSDEEAFAELTRGLSQS